MLRGLLKLTWLELKIFLREPLGAIGTIAVPVVLFLAFGRLAINRQALEQRSELAETLRVALPVLLALFITISAVLSLVTIVSIYRDAGILKRLRVTPLRPWTILGAHVIVKLFLTGVTMALMVTAGRRYFPVGPSVSLLSFGAALIVSTASILSVGFLIASLVPTARFAQPVGALILYPMIPLSGLFVPLESLPRSLQLIGSALPITYAVGLLKGIWRGDPWLAHLTDVAALIVVFVVCTALSTKLFRWE